MRRLPLSGSESLLLSAQIALDANGIRYITSGSPVTEGMGPGPLGGILVDEGDCGRALEAIRDLQNTSTESISDAWRSPMFRVFVRMIASGIIWVWLEVVLRARGR